jgi:hypothetical protein
VGRGVAGAGQAEGAETGQEGAGSGAGRADQPRYCDRSPPSWKYLLLAVADPH